MSWLDELEARLEQQLAAFLAANPSQEALLEEQGARDRQARLVGQRRQLQRQAEQERQALLLGGGPTTIRAFDAAITAPRWGYHSVEHYYAEASPLASLLNDQSPSRAPLLLVHAADDPWVPVDALQQLQSRVNPGVNQRGLEVCIPAKGGHNGFHGVGDGPLGSWSDAVAVQWLSALVA